MDAKRAIVVTGKAVSGGLAPGHGQVDTGLRGGRPICSAAMVSRQKMGSSVPGGHEEMTRLRALSFSSLPASSFACPRTQ